MTTARDTVDLLGLRFDRLTRAQAAQAVVDLAASGSKHYVVKPYSEFMPRANRDPRVHEMLAGASLCLADGVGILWAARFLSRSLPEAMHGVDFTWEMLTAIERARLSVYLFGGTTEELRGTIASIAERLPHLRLIGAHQGHLVRGQTADVIQEINAASPDVLLVAMGFPRQERWISKYLPTLNVKVAVAEGGSFSFMSGAVPRAPAWTSRAGLEWAYRLARQPWRLKRQLALPVFAWLVLRERLQKRR